MSELKIFNRNLPTDYYTVWQQSGEMVKVKEHVQKNMSKQPFNQFSTF